MNLGIMLILHLLCEVVDALHSGFLGRCLRIKPSDELFEGLISQLPLEPVVGLEKSLCLLGLIFGRLARTFAASLAAAGGVGTFVNSGITAGEYVWGFALTAAPAGGQFLLRFAPYLIQP